CHLEQHNTCDKTACTTVRISVFIGDRRESLLTSNCEFVDLSETDISAAISKTSAGRVEGHSTGKIMR
ncbi:MAG: hypothetical protein ACKPKO_41830, partial [Candidatus Fonsibacter sp.]